MALAAVSAAVEHPSRALPEGVTSLDRCAPDGERLNYGVEFAYCLRQVRLIGPALINVQFRPDVFLDEGAQAATAIRQLDRAADLRLQVVQGRRSGQGCDHLLQLVPELRQLLGSQRDAVARMEPTCPPGARPRLSASSRPNRSPRRAIGKR